MPRNTRPQKTGEVIHFPLDESQATERLQKVTRRGARMILHEYRERRLDQELDFPDNVVPIRPPEPPEIVA